jgi:branched-chain amino acid transport system substrate-binding protein
MVSRTTLRWAAVALALAGIAPLFAQDREGDDRYGETPEALRPFRRGGEPERRFFTEAPEFRGPGREAAAPVVDAVRLGVLAPAGGPGAGRGRRMQNGIDLAVADANGAGGFAPGVPFELLVRAENESWGAAADAAVDLATRYGVWGFLGALEDEASHVVTRVILKLEVPMVNTSGSDPTLTEHNIPWLVRVRPDDRQACYALAQRIVRTDGHRRIVVFRENSRYARVGIAEFVDATRRLGHPVALAVRFEAHEASWSGPLARIERAEPDAIVVWGGAAVCGRVVRALRAAGLEQPVYSSDRLTDPAFVAAAGAAAEGVVVTLPFDPRKTEGRWETFRKRYRARFGTEPDAVAGAAYDGASLLIAAVREAGLNRPRIRDALFARRAYDGVTGTIRFDRTQNDVSGVSLGRIRSGRVVPE